jgi:1,4-alpha-glucan branching enzyme
MSAVPVTFRYFTSVPGPVFPGAQVFLEGSWNGNGLFSDNWTSSLMTMFMDESGCEAYSATVQIDQAEQGKMFSWGVYVDHPGQARKWIIPTEFNDASRATNRFFRFNGVTSEEVYYLTHCRRLGANFCANSAGQRSMRFALWAPNALHAEVVFGKIWDSRDPLQSPLSPRNSIPLGAIAGGYVADDGTGINATRPSLRMSRQAGGIWASDPDDPGLPSDPAELDHVPYMYRIHKEDGTIAYRTDLFSRCQIGSGGQNPAGLPFFDSISKLDGGVSCSVTVNPEMVTKYFVEAAPYLNTQPPSERVWPERFFIAQDEFWRGEFKDDKKPPSRVEDLIIYELHVGALGFDAVDREGKPLPGSLEDAINLLDHISELGFTAVELLPLSEFGERGEGWGYSTSHYFAIEYSGGGRDQYKFFIKECHRRGIAIIMDVVYNHFSHNGERAEWHYDSELEQNNVYYWYEGQPEDYAAYQAKARDTSLPSDRRPSLNHGGYVDNMSTNYAPRYYEETVRKMFISSAVMLMREFHVDGFRIDQTTSMHAYNQLHADGRKVDAANIFGAKVLRELGRTLRLFNPGVMIMAEDHSGWDEVTMPVDQGGMGVDARWYSDFYHHLAGDTDRGSDTAKLLYEAALYGSQAPLKMTYFAGALEATANQKVVYNESHDEAGNSKGPFFDADWNPRDQDKQFTSHRGLVVASNGAPLVGETRRYAEARCRFAWGVTVLSAGTPLTLFGEEVGAVCRFKYGNVLDNREDLLELKRTFGSSMAKYYRDINALRSGSPALRSRNIRVLHVHDINRTLVFKRWLDGEAFLVFSSLNDQPFTSGYRISHPMVENGGWREVFNSDSAIYGGSNVGNAGAVLHAIHNTLVPVVPHAGVVVFCREH